ncbi:hypothetical protein [Nannocystis punicea]|uniref:Uncharacterized protein n=1 Tax=Nannocystis punicea TaxID=2995304 RepID=A0ABY7GZR8_9BACT|nr:hypothetical protein [Nannocystis poenicansa]WAS92503.1 hypothetical protein O0S08_40505 [Nannocystis poenicansa]
MTMFQCPEHGRDFVISLCVHVDSAVSERRPLAFRPVDHETFLATCWLCDACRDELERAACEDEPSRIHDKLTVQCFHCAHAWADPEYRRNVVRIYADFNNLDEQGRVRLNNIGSLEDLERARHTIMNGFQVVLVAPADFEVQALLVHDGIWRAVPDWSTMRRLAPD